MKKRSKHILVTGVLIIWLIKFGIRPHVHSGGALLFFLGIAPNLIGSFLLPFGAILFFEGRQYLLARIFSMRSVPELRFVCILSLLLLVVNEYLQLIRVFGRTFDYFDLLFSVIGLGVAYFFFTWKLFSLSHRKYDSLLPDGSVG